MSEKLEPCPFCGERERVELLQFDAREWVHCCACDAEGLVCDGLAEAIAAWNRRAARAEVRPAVDREAVARIILECVIGAQTPECCDEAADAILALLSPATSPGEGSSGGRVQAAPDGATEAQHSAGGGKIPGVEEVIRYLRNYGPGTPDTTDMYFMRWAADHLCNLVSREAFWRSQAQTSEAG